MARTGPDTGRIAAHLTRADPRLARVIRAVGPQAPPRRPAGFAALVRAIVSQQVSTAAGAAILRRVCAAGGDSEIPGAEFFRSASPAQLRAAGLSAQKVRYLKGLAEECLDGRLDLDALGGLADEEVIARLCEVHGIGRWTAQMYLLFNLGRADVLPTGDLGLRRAVQIHRGLRALPSEATVARLGARWAPFRSHATYYLWRSLALPVLTPERGRPGRPSSEASRRTATRPARSRRAR